MTVAQTSDGHIVGFADSLKREETTNGKTADLTSLYLIESHHGKGIGKALLQAQLTHLTDAGYTDVFVEVLKANQTRNFYLHYGAVLHHTAQIEIGGKTLDEEIYVWTDLKKAMRMLNKSR